MNAVILTCLVAVASAVPQGYNYPRPTGFGTVGHSSHGGGFAPSFNQNFGSGGAAGGHGFGAVSAPSFSHSGAQHSNFGASQNSNFGGGHHGNFGGGHHGNFGGGHHGNFGGAHHNNFGGAAHNNFGGFSSGGHGFTHAGNSHSNIGGFSHGGSSHGNFGGFSSGGSTGFGGHGGGGHQSHAHQAPIISKHFYIHSAPEETEADVQQETISTGPARKNYRVVFIKAPSQSSRSAALTLQQAQNEEKTVIYVLSKKTDAAEVQAAIHAAPTEASKPEVFFIKYKTNEEAAHAQHTIQSQYDALGGSTHVSDEGFAPVQSVIGVLGQSSGGHSHGQGGAGGSVGSHNHFNAPSSAYIPSN